MNARRAALAGVLVAAVVGLVAWWGGSSGRPETAGARVGVPVAGRPGALSATWFCSSAALGARTSARHFLVLANPAPAPVAVRLSGYSTRGPVGVRIVTARATGTTDVDVDALLGRGVSVMVESPAPQVVVSHRLQTTDYADQTACASTASDRWYFPSQSTVLGSAATLVLFNPFPVDAGADVRVSFTSGVRSPRALNGIVVPSGQTRYVDLGTSVQRRDLFAVTVRLRSGRLVAETVQTDDGSKNPRGVRLQLGVPQARDRWAVPGGFTGPNVAERVVVFNPGRTRVTALVQATPFGGAAAPPEPFEVEVPALRLAVLDLSAESRVPPVGFHSVVLEADGPVVVGRTLAVSGPPGPPTKGVPTRPAVSRGTAIGTGSPVQSRTWLAPAVRIGTTQQSSVMVHNSSAGIALVKVSLVRNGRRAVLAGFERFELEPGDGVAVPVRVPERRDGSVAVLVEASTAVVVEGLETFDGTDDLATDLAVPVPGRGEGPVPLAAG